jgi:uncharacterized protein YjbI with pentapeptide repeats
MLGIDLSECNLRDADLRDADLYRAWLVRADFSGAQLENAIFGEATLGGANFHNCDLRGANFMKAHLYEADFTGATLTGAKFYGAFLERAVLSGQRLAGEWFASAHLKDALLGGADLSAANLQDANLQGTDLRGAILRNTDLQRARLVDTQVEGADFGGSLVHGISVWSLAGTPAKQEGLRISTEGDSMVTVDDLDVAQFIHLLLKREKLRNVIQTITSRAVLILGRFTPERKAILDALAEELRGHRLLPVIFDFERSTQRDLAETIKILAGLSLFVIADVSDPRSVPLELQASVPGYGIPFVTIIHEDQRPFAMFDSLVKYDWVLTPVLTYRSAEVLRRVFKKAILNPALAKRDELVRRKSQSAPTRAMEEFL